MGVNLPRRFTVGIFTATVGLSYSSNMWDTAKEEGAFVRIAMKGLRISEAQPSIAAVREQEQAWREKRRLRSMEEMRAQAGGTQVAAVFPQNGLPVSSMHIDAGFGVTQDAPADRLAAAKDILDKGLITDSEHETIKAKIMAEL
jgi:hypothetical protein